MKEIRYFVQTSDHRVIYCATTKHAAFAVLADFLNQQPSADVQVVEVITEVTELYPAKVGEESVCDDSETRRES
ncbi:hypothetical protein [Dipodfec virus UOA04_Rod_542]|nr:hypothetical protein [Dipodfec virus UOA04_Rod_542]